MALTRGMCTLVLRICVRVSVPCRRENCMLRTGVMERNEGRNERSGIQDTEAART
ncbi:MAG: hypothetical protein ABIN67_24965 [Ferruginibacter sp.]